MQASIGKAFTRHTERRNTKGEKRCMEEKSDSKGNENCGLRCKSCSMCDRVEKLEADCVFQMVLFLWTSNFLWVLNLLLKNKVQHRRLFEIKNMLFCTFSLSSYLHRPYVKMLLRKEDRKEVKSMPPPPPPPFDASWPERKQSIPQKRIYLCPFLP